MSRSSALKDSSPATSSFLTSHYPLQVPSYTEALQNLATHVAGERRATKGHPGTRPKKLITVNINGELFKLSWSTCIRIPVLQSVLEERTVNDDDPEPKRRRKKSIKETMFFERHPTAFAAIVDYVQSNELHVPPSICPKLFAREIVAWGFDIDEVETCCFSGLVHFLWEQDKLSEFHGFLNKTKWGYDAGDLKRSSSQGARQQRSTKECIFFILEEPFSSMAATVYFYIMCFFILLTFVMMLVESVKRWEGNEALQIVMIVLNVTVLSYLTIDYVMRFVCCPSRKLFLRQPINITDALALLASYVHFIAFLDLDSQYKKTFDRFQVFFELMEVLRLLRVLRILRPMSKVSGFRLIYFTLKASFHELLLVMMLLLFLIVIFSSFMYYLSDDNIPSIPHAMWYCLITLTTVGYGDIAPVTVQGKIFGSIVAVFGIIVMSMTMPIMVSNFNTLYINAVVGRPNAIKQIHRDLDKEITKQMHSCANVQSKQSTQSERNTEESDRSSASPRTGGGCCSRLKKFLACQDEGSHDRLHQIKRRRRFGEAVDLDTEADVMSIEEEETMSKSSEHPAYAKLGNKWRPLKGKTADLQEALKKLESAGLIRRRRAKEENSQEELACSESDISPPSDSSALYLSVPGAPNSSVIPSRLDSHLDSPSLQQPNPPRPDDEGGRDRGIQGPGSPHKGSHQ